MKTWTRVTCMAVVVLLINMMNFGAHAPIWTDPLNELADWGQRFFFEMKSWRILGASMWPACPQRSG